MGYPKPVRNEPKRLAHTTDRSRRNLNLHTADFYTMATNALNLSRAKLVKMISHPLVSPSDLASLSNALIKVLETSAKMCQIPWSLNPKTKSLPEPLQLNAQLITDADILKHAQEILASEGLEFKPTGTAGTTPAGDPAGTAGTDAALEVAGTAGGADQAEPEPAGAQLEPGPGPGPGGPLPAEPAGPIQRAVLAHARKKASGGS